MTSCPCGTPIPDGFICCPWCEPTDDADPLPLDPEDVKLNGMDDEAADYADIYGNLEAA